MGELCRIVRHLGSGEICAQSERQSVSCPQGRWRFRRCSDLESLLEEVDVPAGRHLARSCSSEQISLPAAKCNGLRMTFIEIRPCRDGWQVSEAPRVIGPVQMRVATGWPNLVGGPPWDPLFLRALVYRRSLATGLCAVSCRDSRAEIRSTNFYGNWRSKVQKT